MFTVQIKVGRLCEHRVASIDSDGELAMMSAKAREVMGAARVKVVMCSDFRALRVLAPELAQRFVDRIRHENTKVERCGILVTPAQGVLALQMTRMCKEMGGDIRQVFRESEKLKLWLGEALDPKERTQLGKFLDEGAAAGA